MTGQSVLGLQLRVDIKSVQIWQELRQVLQIRVNFSGATSRYGSGGDNRVSVSSASLTSSDRVNMNISARSSGGRIRIAECCNPVFTVHFVSFK